MLKYLRIAVTALSLTACVLLIAMWVRSYLRLDILERRTASRRSNQLDERPYRNWATLIMSAERRIAVLQ